MRFLDPMPFLSLHQRKTGDLFPKFGCDANSASLVQSLILVLPAGTVRLTVDPSQQNPPSVGRLAGDLTFGSHLCQDARTELLKLSGRD